MLNFYLIVCGFVLFFWKQMENSFGGYFAAYTIKFPTNWCVFQPCRSETVGGNTFPAGKS